MQDALVSWWDMEKFSGANLHAAIGVLDRLHWWFSVSEVQVLPVPLVPNEERIRIAKETLPLMEDIFRRTGLVTSAETVSEFIQDLTRTDLVPEFEARHVVSRTEEITRTLRREMKNVFFLRLFPEEAKWAEKPTDGWKEILERFPKLSIDVHESSFCFAFGRYAASIFHVLLVAEFGVIEIAKIFGVEGDKPGWGCLDRLERIEKKDYKDKNPLEQKHSSFLKDILPFTFAMKNSWRHKVSHVENKLDWIDTDFSPRLAEEIISATRGFMRRLAKDLPTSPCQKETAHG